MEVIIMKNIQQKKVRLHLLLLDNYTNYGVRFYEKKNSHCILNSPFPSYTVAIR